MTDTQTYTVFKSDSKFTLSKIKVDTLIAAIEKKDPKNISLAISLATAGDATTLNLTLNVHYDYIPEIEEFLAIPIKIDVNEDEVLKQQIINSN